VTSAEFLQLVATAAVMFVSGLAVSDLVTSRFRMNLGGPERALGAIVGSACLSVGLMVLNIMSGGAIFGSRWPVPLAVIIVLTARWIRRNRIDAASLKPSWGAACVIIAVLAIFVFPLISGGRGVRTGDPPWHLGWTEQLLAGEPVPVGPAPDPFARNAYPWGVHAVLATGVRVVPGSDPLTALGGLHILIAAGIALGAASLARLVDLRSGVWAAGCAALVGGFGWIQARAPDFVFSPRNARYGADLVVASPNSAYELFPPALPRELGLVLLATVGWALARKRTVLAGVLAGVTGLVSAPMFVAAIVWIIFAGAATRTFRSSLSSIGIGIAVFLLWAGPVLRDFVRFSGFVDITPRLGREWPIHESLLSWGLLLPLAVAGVVFVLRKKEELSGVLVALMCGSFAVLVLSLLRAAFGWSLAGNATLLHQGRVWPHAHLIAATFGGIAMVTISRWLSARRATALVAVGVLFAGASPALGSVAVARMLREGGSGFVYGSPDLTDGSFVRRAAEHLSTGDVLDSGQAPLLGFTIWQFSGCRLVGYDDRALAGNDLRIRFKDLAERWEEGGREAEADLALVPGSVPGALETGDFAGEQWSLIAL
jgi:hypothetical protein